MIHRKQPDKDKPKYTPLCMADILDHHAKLLALNVDNWRFVKCEGGSNFDLCKACKRKNICDQHEEEEACMLQRFVNTFGG